MKPKLGAESDVAGKSLEQASKDTACERLNVGAFCDPTCTVLTVLVCRTKDDNEKGTMDRITLPSPRN
jgi:hypothetical protein